MILRKPYAILIKRFKMIHVILTLLMLFILYKTGMLMSFFGDYFKTGESILGQDIASGLINIQMYIVLSISILGLITVLVLMYMKEKPVLYYIYGIVTYIFVIGCFIVTHNTLVTMEGQIVSARITRAMSDLTNISFLAQCVAIVMTFIRATGFDIKKFNFVRDLQELDIAVEDNEEFEVDVELDTEKFSRGFNKRLRHLKYIYIENKFLMNIGIAITAVAIAVGIYLSTGALDKVYRQGTYFSTYEYTMKVNNSYITDKDSDGNELANYKSLIILEISVKNKSTKPLKLELAKMELAVGDKHYYPVKTYKEELKDLGDLYQNEKITQEESTYLFAYEIPKNYLDKKIVFKYINSVSGSKKKMITEYARVNISANDLRKDRTEKIYKLGDSIDFSNSVLKESKFKLSSFTIEKEFKLPYRFCATSASCNDSFEYVKANILTNYDKSLLKVKGEFGMDKSLKMQPVTNLYNFIDMFGTLEYKIGTETKTHQLKIEEVIPNYAKNSEDYYLEILTEVKKADAIKFIFSVRNQKYEYILK